MEERIGSLCARRLSRYAAIASLMLSIASALDLPCERPPGSDGTSATYTPSSSCSIRTRYRTGCTSLRIAQEITDGAEGLETRRRRERRENPPRSLRLRVSKTFFTPRPKQELDEPRGRYRETISRPDRRGYCLTLPSPRQLLPPSIESTCPPENPR